MFFARIFLLTGFRAQPAIFPKLQKVAAPCGPILTTHSDTSGTVVRPTFHLAFRPSSYDFLLAIRRAGNRYGSCERFKVSRRQTIELCSWSPLYRCVRSFSFLQRKVLSQNERAQITTTRRIDFRWILDEQLLKISSHVRLAGELK